MLIGRPSVIEQRIERFGLTLKVGLDLEIINPEDDPRYREYVALYHSLVERKGVNVDSARTIVRTNTTVIGTLALQRGEADALLCGLEASRNIRGTFSPSLDQLATRQASQRFRC